MIVQVEFMRRHNFAYEAVAGEEYQTLKPDLVKVQESVGNSAFAIEIKQPTSKDAFFKARLHVPAQIPQLIQCHRSDPRSPAILQLKVGNEQHQEGCSFERKGH